MDDAKSVLRIADLSSAALESVLHPYGVTMIAVADSERIPGTFWGEPEAGLIGNRLFARTDTPTHSVLHELSHYVCMTPDRRAGLHTDAGGDTDEECAVCCLQLLLACSVTEIGLDRALQDMDAWGYSFREGSAAAWYAGDADAARRWLLERRLMSSDGRPTWRLNSCA